MPRRHSQGPVLFIFSAASASSSVDPCLKRAGYPCEKSRRSFWHDGRLLLYTVMYDKIQDNDVGLNRFYPQNIKIGCRFYAVEMIF